jgi:hypothetical protein
MALPFGVMIRQLKRTQMLSEITQVRLLRCASSWSAADAVTASGSTAVSSVSAFNATFRCC